MDGIKEAVEGFVTGAIASAFSLINEHKAERLKMRILEGRLLKGGYRWRSLTRLARAIGQSEETTTDLLLKMKARRSEGERNVWTLDK
jgi:hypothetical protein